MAQSYMLYVGMDVHKESIAVAYVAQEHGAEAGLPRYDWDPAARY